MRGIITKQQEITETEFILLLDDRGIGLATYNKIKKDFRVNCEKAGINYNAKQRLYHVGTKQNSLTDLPLEEKQELV